MTIQDIDNKIKVLNTEMSITSGSEGKQIIQRKISVLRFKREIETIKQKIEQLNDY